jgi:hypothetical protein
MRTLMQVIVIFIISSFCLAEIPTPQYLLNPPPSLAADKKSTASVTDYVHKNINRILESFKKVEQREAAVDLRTLSCIGARSANSPQRAVGTCLVKGRVYSSKNFPEVLQINVFESDSENGTRIEYYFNVKVLSYQI